MSGPWRSSRVSTGARQNLQTIREWLAKGGEAGKAP